MTRRASVAWVIAAGSAVAFASSCAETDVAPTPQLDDAATPTDGARAYDAAPPAEQACGSLAPIAKCGVAIEPSPPPAPDTTTCAKRFGDRGEQLVQSVFVDGSGNIRVIGTFEGNVDFGGGVRSSLGAGVPGGPPSTLFVAAYDPSCQLIWSKQLADSIGVFDRAGGVLITQSSNKNVWFDPAGNVIAEVEMIAPIMPPVTAADPEGGIAIATAAYQTAQGGGGGALVHSGALSRFDHTGKLVWTVSLDDYAAPVIVTIDRQGNVLVADTTRHSLSKYAASNGTKLWCLAEATQAKWASLVVDGDGGARLSSVLDTKLDILEVTAAGCVRRRRRLQLPPTMAFTTSYKGAATGLNGSVAVAPSGEVYVATANEHIETASFASDDTLVATGVYARKGRHPAPANAYGPSGELVLAGGFTQVDMDLGTLALSNAFAWSTDAFFVKNPPHASLGSDPPPAPPAPAAPTTVRAAMPYAIVTSGGAMFWVELTGAAKFGLFTCPAGGCGGAAPLQIGTFDNGFYGLRATAAGVLGVAGVAGGSSAKLLRCTSSACTAEVLPIAAERLAVGATSLAFVSRVPAPGTGVDVRTCPLDSCAGGATLLKSGFQTSPAGAYGLVVTPSAVDFGSSLTLTCPVTGCGTSPGAGTEWISLGPRALLATDATAVYAHEETRVTSCPFSGCVGGPIVLAGGLGRTSGSIFANPLVISDGTSIYFVDDGKTAPWVRSTGPRLLRCPASGCDAAGPTLLWSAPPAPNDAGYVPDWLALAVDDANVYFAARQVDGTTVLSMLLK